MQLKSTFTQNGIHPPAKAGGPLPLNLWLVQVAKSAQVEKITS
jgi:hypothetical protein